MKKILFIFLFLPFVSIAQESRNFFTNLSCFGYGVYALQASEKAVSSKSVESEGPEAFPVVYPKISNNIKDKILVCYTEGPSADPGFVFYKRNEKNELAYLCEVGGEEIYFPGNGSVYTVCRANNHFRKRKKYTFVNNELKECKQAFYYVGLKTKTLAALELFVDYECTEKMADVAANSEIEVIAADFTDMVRKFLIKTPFGLIGWWVLDKEYPASEQIDKIYYQGD